MGSFPDEGRARSFMNFDFLTTEELRKKFKNNFDLCNFSINMARNVIMGGQPMTLYQVLEMIDERASEERAPNAFSG